MRALMPASIPAGRADALPPGARKLVFTSIGACRSEFERATRTQGTLPWEAV